MLTNGDIREELKYIEDVRISSDNEEAKANLKALSLIVQLLHNIRTNIVISMKHQGIELVKPKERVEEEKD